MVLDLHILYNYYKRLLPYHLFPITIIPRVLSTSRILPFYKVYGSDHREILIMLKHDSIIYVK